MTRSRGGGSNRVARANPEGDGITATPLVPRDAKHLLCNQLLHCCQRYNNLVSCSLICYIYMIILNFSPDKACIVYADYYVFVK